MLSGSTVRREDAYWHWDCWLKRVEAAADDFAEVLYALTSYLREPHRGIGAECGEDACIVCLAEAEVKAALARHGSFLKPPSEASNAPKGQS